MDTLDLEEEEKGKRNKSYTYLGTIGKVKCDRVYKAPNTMLSTYDSRKIAAVLTCGIWGCAQQWWIGLLWRRSLWHGFHSNFKAASSLSNLKVMSQTRNKVSHLVLFDMSSVFRHLSSCLPNCLSYHLCSLWHICLFVRFLLATSLC